MSISRAAVWGTLLLAVVALQDGATAARIDQNDRRERERFLRVWAGDQARYAPDFLAVVDFDERSARHHHHAAAVSRRRVERTAPRGALA